MFTKPPAKKRDNKKGHRLCKINIFVKKNDLNKFYYYIYLR